MTDRDYMLHAIELARKAEGFTNPNPMVGAVIVKNGRIIGEGYHKRCGELHAERNAFASLTEPADGATLYVTLEPCCHYGKTPPCTEAVIENGISRVFVGSADPNPKVAGKGVEQLRNAGIEVIENFMREECDEINPVFLHYITDKQPYVVLKYAMTMDGKIATKTGASKWITNEESRSVVHRMRHKYMAIMAGIGTVLADDPMLNVRIEGLKSPVRVIVDTNLRIPSDSNIVKSANEIKTIVAYVSDSSNRAKELNEAGIVLMQVQALANEADIRWVFSKLGEMGIDSVLVEGGGTLNDSIIRQGLADCVEVFMAPKIFGGRDAKTPVEGTGVSLVDECAMYRLKDINRYDEDVRLTYVRRI